MIGLIVSCLLLGIVLRLSGKLPSSAPHAFNAFVLFVAFPALILLQIPDLVRELSITRQLLVPISMAWIQFGVSVLLFTWVGKKLRWNAAKTGSIVLCAGLGNTSFVGFPLLESLLGPAAIRYGVIVDQAGTFLCLSTVALVYATAQSPVSARRPSVKEITRRIFTFVPFPILLIAIGWGIAGGRATGVFRESLDRLSQTLVPLALVSVGYQLRLTRPVVKKQGGAVALGLAFKLVLSPLFFTALYVYLCGAKGTITRVTLLEAAMAPMITAAILAEELGFDNDVASLMLGLGIPLSLLTVPFWNRIWAGV